MLISLKAILDLAESRNIAIGAFNVTTLEGIRALVDAAEELDQPIIMQFANAAHSQLIPLEMIGPIMMQFAERASVPVAVRLDHGANFEEVHRALDLGFTGVMYDGSTLSYEQNAANTRAVVEMAEEYGASVEAEIGAMGREEFASAGESSEQEAIAGTYTDPDQAAKFVRETGVDCLACSFGTVHGIYLKTPHLDIPRVGELRSKTGVPIVMHGGSGISDEDFVRVIDQGVRKINFYTYAVKYAGDAVRQKIGAADGNIFFHDIASWGMESMKETYQKTIRVFSKLN